MGGVLSMRTEHFQRVNGYSNLYWGWGAEDDDMAYRSPLTTLYAIVPVLVCFKIEGMLAVR